MPKNTQCGGMTPTGSCRKPAGWGTVHYGRGPCRKHDNLPKDVAKQLPPFQSIKSLAESFARDKDPFDLREEIAITRSALSHLLDQITDIDSLVEHAKAVNMLLNTIGKLVQKLYEIEEGRKYVIRVDQVQRSMQQIIMVVCEAIPDPEQRSLVAAKIMEIASTEAVDAEPAVTMLSTTEQQAIQMLKTSTPEVDDPELQIDSGSP